MRCAKCNVKTWNDDFDFSKAQIDAPALRSGPAQTAQPGQPIKDEPKDALTAFIEKAQAKKGIAPSEIITVEVEVEPDWKFTKQAPQFADNGNVYRQQFRVSNGKPVYRNVEVDCDDFDCVK